MLTRAKYIKPQPHIGNKGKLRKGKCYLFLVTHKLVTQYKMVSYENIHTRNIIMTGQVVIINEKKKMP